jgi:squalene-hopene/tetraprenyl-beta-curcumene cyclase
LRLQGSAGVAAKSGYWEEMPMLAGLLLAIFVTSADSEAATRDVVTRSLRFVEAGGTAWIEQKKCVSCHTVGMMIWTHNEARRRGFAVEAERIRKWNEWALADLLARKDFGGGDTISQVLLAQLRPSGTSPVEPYAKLLDSLASQQRPDGSWKPGQQLQHPPEVSTRWAMLAFDAPLPLGTESAALINDRIPRARKAAFQWLKSEPADDTLEARILRMLMMRKQEPALAQIWLLELMALQNADGGWSYQLGANESDAFATGLAIYAAAVQGHPRDNAQFKRAREFLAKTIREDGSWLVRASHIHSVQEGKDTKGADVIYSYWGTAWATLGLLHTLPEAETGERTTNGG